MFPNRVVNVTEFKAKCLSLFDEVESGKVSITVTRRGKVIGVVNPPPAKKRPKTLAGSWAGKVTINCDLANVDMSDAWDFVNGRDWDHPAKEPQEK